MASWLPSAKARSRASLDRDKEMVASLEEIFSRSTPLTHARSCSSRTALMTLFFDVFALSRSAELVMVSRPLVVKFSSNSLAMCPLLVCISWSVWTRCRCDLISSSSVGHVLSYSSSVKSDKARVGTVVVVGENRRHCLVFGRAANVAEDCVGDGESSARSMAPLLAVAAVLCVSLLTMAFIVVALLYLSLY